MNRITYSQPDYPHQKKQLLNQSWISSFILNGEIWIEKKKLHTTCSTVWQYFAYTSVFSPHDI